MSMVMVVTNSLDAVVTQMASLSFKNFIINSSQTWSQVDEPTRAMIKQALMGLLGFEDVSKVKAGSLCVAAVAFIENRSGLWQDFLPTMTAHATSEPYTANIRFAAMQTLEYYADFITDELTCEQVQFILHATVMNISQSNLQISRMALIALAKTLPFCSENFKIEN